MTSVAAPPARRDMAEANARLGLAFFLLTEAVFFVGLVFFALNMRGRFPSWPPPGAPAPDAALLVGNALCLLVSGGLAWMALGAWGAGRAGRACALHAAALVLGWAFLAGQVAEYGRLGGWQPAGSMYRTLFDSIAALHGLHVLAGLGLLALVLVLARPAGTWPGRGTLLWAAVLYWVFVALSWPVLLAVLTVPS
jgi:heme/copper-type cytochrome/quinol oxidase subunit 3